MNSLCIRLTSAFRGSPASPTSINFATRSQLLFASDSDSRVSKRTCSSLRLVSCCHHRKEKQESESKKVDIRFNTISAFMHYLLCPQTNISLCHPSAHFIVGFYFHGFFCLHFSSTFCFQFGLPSFVKNTVVKINDRCAFPGN